MGDKLAQHQYGGGAATKFGGNLFPHLQSLQLANEAPLPEGSDLYDPYLQMRGNPDDARRHQPVTQLGSHQEGLESKKVLFQAAQQDKEEHSNQLAQKTKQEVSANKKQDDNQFLKFGKGAGTAKRNNYGELLNQRRAYTDINAGAGEATAARQGGAGRRQQLDPAYKQALDQGLEMKQTKISVQRTEDVQMDIQHVNHASQWVGQGAGAPRHDQDGNLTGKYALDLNEIHSVDKKLYQGKLFKGDRSEQQSHEGEIERLAHAREEQKMAARRQSTQAAISHTSNEAQRLGQKQHAPVARIMKVADPNSMGRIKE